MKCIVAAAFATLSFAPARQEQPLLLPAPAPRVDDPIGRLEYAYTAREEPGRVVWSAPNRAHGLRSRVGRDGIELFPREIDASGDGAPWKLALRTTRFGRTGDARDVTCVGVAAVGPRVELDLGSLVEWFVNDERGIEQGWTIAAPPSGGVAPLEIALSFGGALRAAVAEDGRAALLVDGDGTTRLHYRGLTAVDANGRELDARLVASRDGVLLRIDDRFAIYPLHVDPLLLPPGSPDWSAEIGQTSARLGTSVAGAGDVNGDGFGDVIVGAPDYDRGSTDEGRVFVYLGSSTGLAATYSWSAEINSATARFGYSVASAGDVNGDGFDDVIVGAYGYDGGQTNEGKAYVFHGGSGGLSSTWKWGVESDQAQVRFGFAVAGAGDVNGDGFDDVIVGADQFGNVETNEGRAFVYLGSATGLATTPAWTAESNQSYAYFATAVASAGDVNGDGFDDVIVGAPWFDNGKTDEGRCFVYHGSNAGLGAAAAWTAESDQTAADFGRAVAGGGDLNGDGFDDVIVGAPEFDAGETDEGRAFAWFGSSSGLASAPSWIAESDWDGAQFGSSVACAGDFSLNGVDDIVIGVPRLKDSGVNDVGAAYLYVGSTAGPARDPALIARPTQQAPAWFGSSVAGAGDVDGDGRADVVVGAPEWSNGHSSEGGAFLYLGFNVVVPPASEWRLDRDQRWSYFGEAVASAGDVNGDGCDDVIVGAPNYHHGEVSEGVAFVHYGSPFGMVTRTIWCAEGDQVSADLGAAVAGAGDVNGDGYGDVIVGAPKFDHGNSDEGRASLYLGGAAGLASSAAWSAYGNQKWANLGEAVAAAGDVNGDGYDDVIVGVPAYTNGQTKEGRALVYAGSAAGLGATPIWTFESDQTGANLGGSVAGAGDVNGDGFDDVVVGAASYDITPYGHEGRILVFLGSLAGPSISASWIADGGQILSGFGISVAGAGDVNGDGFDDVIVGASDYDVTPSGREGRAYVYLGGPGGLATSAAWIVDGDRRSAQFGCSVASAGDQDGNGCSDVIVGAEDRSIGGTEEGRALLYSGWPTGLKTAPSRVLRSPHSDSRFGYAVAGAGDLNGDGFHDVIVGAMTFSGDQSDEGAAFLYFGGGGARGLGRMR